MTFTLLQPLVIAVLMIVEVAVFQLRVALAGRGRKRIAAGLGAVNALISVAALGQVLTNLDRPANIAGYAVGVAAGVYLGAALDERIGARTGRRHRAAPVRLPAARRPTAPGLDGLRRSPARLRDHEKAGQPSVTLTVGRPGGTAASGDRPGGGAQEELRDRAGTPHRRTGVDRHLDEVS